MTVVVNISSHLQARRVSHTRVWEDPLCGETLLKLHLGGDTCPVAKKQKKWSQVGIAVRGVVIIRARHES